MVKRFQKPVFRFFEQLLFPSKCLKCGRYTNPAHDGSHLLETHFCISCFKNGVTSVEPPFCTVCGKMFTSRSGGNHICEPCIKQPSFLGKVRACVSYEGIIRDAVPLLKYSGKLSLLKAFEPMMQKGFIEYFADSHIDIVMPMPLHKKKVVQRGFNQAYLLVRNLRKKVGSIHDGKPTWQMDLQSLIRIKMTAPQTGFDIKERRKNLKNAFQAKDSKRIKDRSILLIDDVFTTGATANEAAKTLLKAGAKQVDALALART